MTDRRFRGPRGCEWRAARRAGIFRGAQLSPTTRGAQGGEGMILGVGIDLVRTARVAGLLERRGERALARLFTPAEAERCRAARAPDESFAARVAAKEAFFKALGLGLGPGGEWTEVEVVSAASGAPSLRLTGRAAAVAEERGVRRIHLSLTHTDDTSAAVVVLED
jgi:holo-[acyl-carrier protein] synthase